MLFGIIAVVAFIKVTMLMREHHDNIFDLEHRVIYEKVKVTNSDLANLTNRNSRYVRFYLN